MDFLRVFLSFVLKGLLIRCRRTSSSETFKGKEIVPQIYVFHVRISSYSKAAAC